LPRDIHASHRIWIRGSLDFVCEFRGEGKERLRRGRKGKGRKGERREILPLVWELKNQQGKEMDDLCDNFTILPFFLLKSMHCVILCNLSYNFFYQFYKKA